MRAKAIWAVGFIVLFSLFVATGQPANPPIVAVSSAPSGACTGGLPAQLVISTGVIYTCAAGTYGAVGGGSGGPFLPLSGGTLTGTLNGVAINSIDANSAGGNVLLGNFSDLGTIWMGIAPGSTSVTNYALLRDGSGNLAVNAQTGGVVAQRINNTTGTSLSATAYTVSVPILSAGAQTVSGCSLTSALGGSWAGSFHSGTTGTCTVTITPGNTATNGFSCWANDLTTTADILHQTGTLSQTTATIAGTTASGDVVTWGCVAF